MKQNVSSVFWSCLENTIFPFVAVAPETAPDAAEDAGAGIDALGVDGTTDGTTEVTGGLTAFDVVAGDRAGGLVWLAQPLSTTASTIAALARTIIVSPSDRM